MAIASCSLLVCSAKLPASLTTPRFLFPYVVLSPPVTKPPSKKPGTPIEASSLATSEDTGIPFLILSVGIITSLLFSSPTINNEGLLTTRPVAALSKNIFFNIPTPAAPAARAIPFGPKNGAIIVIKLKTLSIVSPPPEKDAAEANVPKAATPTFAFPTLPPPPPTPPPTPPPLTTLTNIGANLDTPLPTNALTTVTRVGIATAIVLIAATSLPPITLLRPLYISLTYNIPCLRGLIIVIAL